MVLLTVGLNEGALRWIIDDGWTYTADLSPLLSQGADQYDSFALHSQALDTIADISIGGKPVASTDNQFRHWTFDVTNHIQNVLDKTSEDRNLTILFKSAAKYADAESYKEPFYPNADTFPDAPTTFVYGEYSERLLFIPSMDTVAPLSLTLFIAKSNLNTAEYPNRQFIRKQQSDLGWDWGPAYVPSGPIKPAYLIGFKSSSHNASESARRDTLPEERQLGVSRAVEREDKNSTEQASTAVAIKSDGAFVTETSIDIYRKGQVNNLPPDQNAPWIVNVSLSLWSVDEYAQPKLSLSILNTSHASGELKLSGPIKEGQNEALHAHFEVPSSKEEGGPELWWPAALGGPPKLYEIEMRLSGMGDSSISWTKRSGFRTIVLNQEKYTAEELSAHHIQPGSKFQFEINGQPFFTNGANIITFDTFYPRISSDVLRWHLESAVLAGQSMLRIWGGAQYQSEEFYDICDELGILAWSETIFADSAYPTYDS